MRELFAQLIVAIARALTFPFFGPVRRADVFLRISTMLSGCYRVDENEDPAIEMCTNGETLLLALGGHLEALGFREFEPDTMEWLETLHEGAVLWDIGANVGIVALLADLRHAQVLAFEPAARNFAALNKNIELNAADSIKAYCIAFAEETAIDTLNMANTDPGSSMHGFGTTEDQFGQSISVAFCQGAVGFSIDDFVNLFSPQLPTHVKIDVDGIEAGILRGGRMTLSAPSIQSMIVEMEGDLGSLHNREILDLMAEFGFLARPKASPHLRNVIFDRRTA